MKSHSTIVNTYRVPLRRTTSWFMVALCGAAAAQTRTLPIGYQGRPGEWSAGTGVGYPFGESANFEYQEVHTDWTGTVVPPLNGIGFRRGPNRAANTTAVGHAIDMTLSMGPGDTNAFTSTFATNYVGSPTVVFATRTISMPDWALPSLPRELFSLVVPLDAPYAVNTQYDFIWHLLVENSSLPDIGASFYYADRTGSRTATPTLLGAGCTATGRTAPITLAMAFTNTGGAMSMSYSGSNYPASAPVVLHLGLAELNQPVAGLCASVHARPDLALPLGSTTAAGVLTPRTLPLPFVRALRHSLLYMQAVAPDAGQPGIPLVLSEGREGGVPCGPVFKYVYSTSPPAPIGNGPFNAGSVITAYY